MWKNMRNALAAALILVMVSAVCLAAGTHDPWTCPQCGKTDNTGNYCGDCGHPAPWLEEPEPVSGTEEEFLPEQEEEPALPEVRTPVVPVFSDLFPGMDVRLRNLGDSGSRVSSYSGPDKSYVSTGGYKPYKQKSVTAYFLESGWVYADIVYESSEERMVYFSAGSFETVDGLPEIAGAERFAGRTTEAVDPCLGPDSRFNTAKNFRAEADTVLSVLFQENGYVYAEYSCAAGTVRMWFPADKVELENAVVTYPD